MLSMVIGIGQLGTLFFANAGLQHSVEQAARVAAVYPTPDDAVILEEFQGSRFGTNETLTPTLTIGRDDGMDVMDVSASYTVPLEFIFFDIAPVTLTHTRRVFLQEESTFVSGTTRPSTTSTGSTTGSTTGGTNSTGSTSTGGTTSASSSGGTLRPVRAAPAARARAPPRPARPAVRRAMAHPATPRRAPATGHLRPPLPVAARGSADAAVANARRRFR